MTIRSSHTLMVFPVILSNLVLMEPTQRQDFTGMTKPNARAKHAKKYVVIFARDNTLVVWNRT
jgi:hypothetical protein